MANQELLIKLYKIEDEYWKQLRLTRICPLGQSKAILNRKIRASELAMEYNSVKPWYLPRLKLV